MCGKLKILRLVLIAYVLLSNSVHSEVLIGKGHVGPLSVGDEKDVLLHKWGDKVKESSIMLEGEPQPVLNMVFDCNHSVIIELNEENKVTRFRISDNFFKTEKNIGVGSSFKEVMDAYPKHDIYTGLEEGGYLSIYVEELAAC